MPPLKRYLSAAEAQSFANGAGAILRLLMVVALIGVSTPVFWLGETLGIVGESPAGRGPGGSTVTLAFPPLPNAGDFSADQQE